MRTRHAILATALLLTGCGTAAHADTAATAAPTSSDLRLGFQWNAVLAAPGLAHMRPGRLVQLGETVCDDLNNRTTPAAAWPRYGRVYGVTDRQAVAAAHAAVAYLCPELAWLAQPS